MLEDVPTSLSLVVMTMAMAMTMTMAMMMTVLLVLLGCLQLDINTVAAGGGSRLFFRNGLFAVG